MTGASNKKKVTIALATSAVCFVLLWWFFLMDRVNFTSYEFEQHEQQEEQDLSEHCTLPYPGKPLIQYAVMLDAGSSGSRVHIYKFNHCKKEPELEDEVFRMLEPGLSSFADTPQAAAESLDELLDLAVESVPTALHHCTPIALKATAGLRLLPQEQQNQILSSVRQRMEERYPFPIAEKGGVEIMDGKEEGVFAWITVNYLLSKLRQSEFGNSVATFDLGGASTQIVFEPEFASEEKMLPGEHAYQLDYGAHNYLLYQHSYLGFGLKEARKSIKHDMIGLWESEAATSGRVFHPCLPDGHTEFVDWTHGNKTKKVELVGTGAGHSACRGVIEKFFGKDKACTQAPCAFDGVYQPSLSDTFHNRDLYIFSFFYDLTQPLGMPTEFSVRELGEFANRVCNYNMEAFQHVPNALGIIKTSPDYCLDLTFTHALLRIGYDIPPERLVRTAKKINDAETGWCLGASITMIDNHQLCKL